MKVFVFFEEHLFILQFKTFFSFSFLCPPPFLHLMETLFTSQMAITLTPNQILAQELELHYWEMEQEERRQQTGVDYSWLVSNCARSFQIPPIEHAQLVVACQQVQPDECSIIIKLFRDALLRMPPLNEVTGIFKAVITQVNCCTVCTIDIL